MTPTPEEKRDVPISLMLKRSSWRNLFEVIRDAGTTLNTKGNFWAALQHLEQQLDEMAETTKAIRAAVEEERDACEKVVRSYFGTVLPVRHHEVLSMVASEIRARGDKG